MPQIYIMAIITLTFAVVLYGGLLYAVTGRQKKWLWLLLPGLPLSALANLLIKKPLIVGVGQAAGIAPGLKLETPVWFIIFVWLVPPVVEELTKIVPLLIPPIRKFASGREEALWTGLALGISFGLGEAAFLAYGVAQSPEYASYPWYSFTGYLTERLIVCLFHGLMTAIVVAGWQRGPKWGVLGYLTAVFAHFVVNAGAVLYQLGLAPAWAASLSLIPPAVALGILFEWLRRRADRDPEKDQSEGETVFYHRPDTDIDPGSM